MPPMPSTHPPTVPSALITNHLLDSQNAFWCISSPTEVGLEGRMFEVAGQTPFCLNSLNKLFVCERKTGKLKWVFISNSCVVYIHIFRSRPPLTNGHCKPAGAYGDMGA